MEWMPVHTFFETVTVTFEVIGVAAMALGIVIAARPLSFLFGIPVFVLTSVGLVLLPFAAWVGWLARQNSPPRKLVWLLIASNVAWVADSFLLMLSDRMPLTALGSEFIAIQALLTAGITTLEFVAIRRTAERAHLTA